MQVSSAQGAANLLAAPVPVPRRAIRNLRKVGSLAHRTRHRMSANKTDGVHAQRVEGFGVGLRTSIYPFCRMCPHPASRPFARADRP
jgi:hypothetical protein